MSRTCKHQVSPSLKQQNFWLETSDINTVRLRQETQGNRRLYKGRLL